jgi:hypothetical protein
MTSLLIQNGGGHFKKKIFNENCSIILFLFYYFLLHVLFAVPDKGPSLV